MNYFKLFTPNMIFFNNISTNGNYVTILMSAITSALMNDNNIFLSLKLHNSLYEVFSSTLRRKTH